MTVHSVVPNDSHRLIGLPQVAVVALVGGFFVFGWSLRFAAFVSFAAGAGVLGTLDWKRSVAMRFLAGWSVHS